MTPALSSMLFWIPTIILSLIGIAAAAVYYTRHPIPSMLVLAACLLSIVRAIAIPLLQGFGVGITVSDRIQWQTWISVFAAATSAVTFALFLAAAFVGRRNSTATFANQSPYDNSKPIVMAEFAQSDRNAANR
jgi:hypothetical protein